MAIDMSKIAALGNKIANTGSANQKIDFKSIFWKPVKDQTHEVRIVPSVFDKSNPFRMIKQHWNVAKGALNLSSIGQPDPIEEFIEELKGKGGDSWQVIRDIRSAERYVVPVIVRGEESAGVRLWSISKTVLSTLISYIQDDDYGDITDPQSGRDLRVKVVQGQQFPETTVNPRVKSTPLSEDSVQLKKWLENQPNPEESFFKLSYDQLKERLTSFLNLSPAETSVTGKVAQETKKASTEEIDKLFG